MYHILQRRLVYTSSMSKTFWAIIAVIILIFGGIIMFKGEKSDTSGSGNGLPTNHTIGEGSTGVVLTEYGDFECPVCGQYFPLVEQVVEKYKTQITFQFRHLPLVEIHKNAFAAARAAEAADKQGKFWEMYKMIFQNQANWANVSNARGVFEQYATQLGLNLEQFKADAASAAANDAINADIAEFKKTGAEKATPTFFLDGKKIEPKSLEDFTKLIDEAIAAKKQ